MPNVVIIDDDTLVTTSLKTILEAGGEINVLATGSDGAEAMHLYAEYKPDVLLMDIQMKETNGLDAAKEIIEKYPDARILFLTTFSDDAYIVSALSCGAKGYLLKSEFNSILPAIRAVMSGQSVFGSEIVEKLPKLLDQKNTFDYSACDIQEKELAIIRLVAKGLNNKEIGEALFLSEGTVRNYLSTILEKLNLRDRTQLAVFYLSKKDSGKDS